MTSLQKKSNLKSRSQSAVTKKQKLVIKKSFAQIAIVMGSESDLATLKPGLDLLKKWKVPYSTEVVSAHRTPERMYEFARQAHTNGFQVIIAAAGGAAHLPGMVASLSILPVIGVPVESSKLNGIDSLLSIAQMPAGVPVATMAIGNSVNAVLLALQILALNNPSLALKLLDFRKEQNLKVQQMNQRIRKEIK